MTNDKRLIEDFLPIQAISAEASWEKWRISDSHLWRTRRDRIPGKARNDNCD